jgi:predicted nucleic acid-binding OB-fold protein
MYYILVSSEPEKLALNEMVIHKPNFLEEITATKGKRGVDKITSITSIRDMISLLAGKYDNDVNPYRVNLVKYENLPYTTDKDFSDIILRIIKENDLKFIEKAIEQKVKTRKASVDTVYYVSEDLIGTSVLISYGFHMKDGKNSKKISSNKDHVV